MAPPQDRRPGFSRRAQYGIFTGYLVAALGALAGLVLLVVSMINPGALGFARGAAAEAAAPAGVAGAGARDASRGILGTIGGYFTAGAENRAMREELALARARHVEAQALAAENRRLKALLGLVEREGRPVAVARLIGSTAGSTRRFATIAVGTRQGVRSGMPVRSAMGLIGRVLEAGPNTARVLLVTDAGNVVPVRRAQDDVAGFAEGRADGRLAIRLINLGINPLKPGDVFVTSGAGGLYRPGIPVGVAARLTRDGAVARIVADPAAADYVIVDPVWQRPAPPPAPPPTPPPEASE